METGYTVLDAMTKHPVSVPPGTDVRTCAQKMSDYNIGSLLVVDNSNIVGILTEEDMVFRVLATNKNPDTTKVDEIMSTSVVTIAPDADIYDAMVKMRDGNIRHLPVSDGDGTVGFLTMKDILKIEPDLFDMLVENFQLREEERKPIFGERPQQQDSAEDQQNIIAEQMSEEYEAYGDDRPQAMMLDDGLDEEERL